MISGSGSGSQDFANAEEKKRPEDGGAGEGETYKGRPKGRAVDSLDPDFDAFWKAYPVHKAKQQARLAWDEMRPDAKLVSLILAAIERQKRTEQWRKRIIPHADNWLRGERWKDEIDEGMEVAEALADRVRRQKEELQAISSRDATMSLADVAAMIETAPGNKENERYDVPH